MNLLAEKAREFAPTGVFTYSDALIWLGGTRNSVRCKVMRAIDAGDVLSVRRGLYCLAKRHRPVGVSRNLLANLIYGPSYISVETALAFHGWIPEAVHSVSSISLDRARSFETPFGYFDYVQVRQTPLLAGVERIVGDQPERGSFYMAKPLKALADYVASHGLDWTGAVPLVESLRIDEDNLETLRKRDFDELEGVYKSARARKFLSGLRKELGK